VNIVISRLKASVNIEFDDDDGFDDSYNSVDSNGSRVDTDIWIVLRRMLIYFIYFNC